MLETDERLKLNLRVLSSLRLGLGMAEEEIQAARGGVVLPWTP